MDLAIQGKRALVTGSSSGLGEAIARQLARQGADVVVHGRRETEVRRVVQSILADTDKCVGVLGDLSTDDGAAAVASAALQPFGGIDIVVNNAGVGVPDTWTAADPQLWLELYNLDVVSMVRVIRHLMPQMTARGWGRFIQIASVVAVYPDASAASYSAAKSAIINLSCSLAKSLANTGVTANAICPGIILTTNHASHIRHHAARLGWTGDWATIERRFIAEQSPNLVGRAGRPDEVADLVAFLASPRADFITGTNLYIDGGFSQKVTDVR